MKIILKEPADGAAVQLLPAAVRDYLKRGVPIAGGNGPIDWNSPVFDSEEQSRPLPVILRFRAEDGEGPFRVSVSENRDFTGAAVYETARSYVKIDNLKAGAWYFWKAASGSCVSPVFSFVTDPTPPRLISVGGATNVRDLGGRPAMDGRFIRQGLIFRGSELNVHTCLTDAGRRVLTSELGIRTELDFRGEAQGRVHESALGEEVRWAFLPCFAYGEFLFREHWETCRSIFSLLADPSVYPVYMHCWGGADRTGTVAFLLEALLGADDESLMQDYELTSFSTSGSRSRNNLQFRQFLFMLDRYEGADYAAKVYAFLTEAGVTEAEIASIRALLLTEA